MPPEPAMRLALLCTGLQAALIFGLGLRVSMLRLALARARGDDPRLLDGLKKAVRAHGNAAEYVPTLCLLMLVLAWLGAGPLVTGLFLLATASRYSHALGMIVCPTLDRPHPLRFFGASGTYAAGLLMAACLVFR